VKGNVNLVACILSVKVIILRRLMRRVWSIWKEKKAREQEWFVVYSRISSFHHLSSCLVHYCILMATVFIHSIPDCKLLLPLLNRLAGFYPSTKFVSIISDHCIDSYPDKNCPTLLIYRKGEMTGQVVGMGGMGGNKATVEGSFCRRSFVFALSLL
jgi:hypothetical protein